MLSCSDSSPAYARLLYHSCSLSLFLSLSVNKLVWAVCLQTDAVAASVIRSHTVTSALQNLFRGFNFSVQNYCNIETLVVFHVQFTFETFHGGDKTEVRMGVMHSGDRDSAW